MPGTWRVTVTVGRPEPAIAERIERSLPADTLPAHIGYSGDMRLSMVMVTVTAENEELAGQLAQAMVKKACVAAGWSWEPEARTIEPSTR